MPVRLTMEELSETIRTESIEKGFTKDCAELNEEIARKMKKEKADYDFISRVTSLPY